MIKKNNLENSLLLLARFDFEKTVFSSCNIESSLNRRGFDRSVKSPVVTVSLSCDETPSILPSRSYIADNNESIIESCLEIGKLNVRFVKSIEPDERDKFFGDNDDESDEIVVGGGDDDDDEGRYREEFDGVLKDEDIELLLSRSDNGGGGGDEFTSWNEVLRYNEGFIWFVGDGELEICLCDNEKFFRCARIFDGDSIDWIGVALSLKSISLNSSNIILWIS